VYESPIYSSALCNSIFVQIWIFLSFQFEKQVSETWWTLRQRWVDFHILWSRSSPELLKLNPSPTIYPKVLNLKSKSKCSPRELTKYSFLTTKMCNFTLSQSKSGPDPVPKFAKRSTVRIKSEEVHYSPDPVLSKSSPMVISAPQMVCAWLCRLIVCWGMSG